MPGFLRSNPLYDSHPPQIGQFPVEQHVADYFPEQAIPVIIIAENIFFIRGLYAALIFRSFDLIEPATLTISAPYTIYLSILQHAS